MVGIGLVELLIIIGILGAPLVVLALVFALRQGGHPAPGPEDED